MPWKGKKKENAKFMFFANCLSSINVALTIEPSNFGAHPNEKVPAPPCRLCAAYVVNGFYLPDPSTPNRLTVWFTGGKLSPAPPPSDEYGGLEEWKQLFSGDHKRTWGEKFSLLGAKIKYGAEVSNGMDAGGTMSYTLHRPQGGHGTGYVDVSALVVRIRRNFSCWCC